MRKAKVLVTDLLARGNKIFHTGQTVEETNFNEGKFQKLIDGKYIEEIVEVETKVEEPVLDAEPKKVWNKPKAKKD